MVHSTRRIKQSLILMLLLSGCTEPPTSLAMTDNDGRTEWTKEGKEKIRAEWAEEQRLHDEFEKTYKSDNHRINKPSWIVIDTICGTTINNHVHGGRWPYSSALSFKTKAEAKKHMERYCDRGCKLIFGVEQ